MTATVERTTVGARSMPAHLLARAAERPTAVALRKKELGRWKEYTWATYAERTAHVGLGLRALGVEPGDRVAVHSGNRPAWLFADIGIQGIGAVTVGIYPTSPSAEVEYILSNSGAKVLIAEDEEQVDKVLEIREKLPDLKHVVVIDPRGLKGVGEDPWLISLADLESRGSASAIEGWSQQVSAIDPSALAIIVYTSGTTGPPKGAMLSHANLVAAGEAFQLTIGAQADDEVLSYLPLCHVAERLTSCVNALAAGYVVNFGEGGESFPTDMREVQPTYFLGVPRVWEKMLAGVSIRMSDATPFKRLMYSFWMKQGTALAARRMQGGLGPVDKLRAAVGYLMMYRWIRDKLGLGRVRLALSGAAPIAPQVLEYFWALGVQVREGYGQTEGTALGTFTPADDVRLGSVGVPVHGVEVKIADDGEILLRGPGVFLGYWKNDAATAQTITPDGWLLTGDVGVLSDGHLTITDRKKDIIITAGGKNISPSEIENRMKVSPWIREAIVIGDGRKHLVALIGIEGDIVGDWATRQRLSFTTYADLTSKPEVRTLVEEWVAQVNSELADSEEVKRFELLPKELDPEQGELTATQKVKRAAIAREFADLIEGMYQ